MMKQKMQRSFGLMTALALGVTVSLPTQAALNCPAEVGTLFNGKKSGTYCVSKISMTWWSAFTWCEAIGGKLATWAEACPGNTIGSTCANLNGAGGPDKWAWTAEPLGQDRAYLIYVSTGAQDNPTLNPNYYRNSNSASPSHSALCK